MLNMRSLCKGIVSFIFFIQGIIVFGQTTIVSQTFEGIPSELGYIVSNSNFVNIDNTYGDASTSSLRFSNNNGSNNRNSNVIFDEIDISAFSNISVSISFASFGVDNNENLFIAFSYDGGGFTDEQKLIDGGGGESWDWGTPDDDGGAVTSNPFTFYIPDGFSSLGIRVRARQLDDNEFFYIDNLLVKSNIYCNSSGNSTDGYTTGIRRVDFNTISNTSPIEDNDYSDFTSISTTLEKNSSYDLSVNLNTDGNYIVFAVAWIDWNHDGVFSDVNERYELGSTENDANGLTSLSPLSILVPITANTGSTRMRVSAKWIEYPASCETGFDGEVEDYTINVTCGTNNSWTGAVSDDWNIDGNWSCGEVPSITNNTDVLIPTGLSTYPIIYSVGADGYVNNIEFENGSTLTVLDNSFEIVGTLLLNGSIDLEGESQLIQGPTSNFDIASTGFIEIDQQGEGNLYRYNYWSSPVYTATDVNGNYTTINDALRDGTNTSPGSIVYTSGVNGSTSPVTLSTIWMYKFSDRNSDYSQWQFIGNSGNIYSAEGFSLKGTGAIGEQNYVFVGKPNNGTITLSVSGDNNYLVGNPYPSAIDANQFLMDNSPSGTGSIGGSGALYFWEHYGGNSHNLADYQAGYSTYSLSGGVPASSYPGLGGGSSVKGAPERYIPVGQGFFIEADADGGDIEFNNGQRIFVTESSGNSVFMKGSTTKGKLSDDNTIDLRPKFRIGFDAPEINHRQLLLTIDENASDAIDWGYDAAMYQLFDDDMFWLLDNSKYVIQATNEILGKKEFQLGIKTEKGGEISIKIDELLNVSEDTRLYIKDNVTGMLHNISANDFEIYLEPGEYLDRFSIVFESNKPVVEEVILGDEIIVFMNNVNSQLVLKNAKNNNINTVQVFNTMGQLVSNWDNLTFDVEMNLPLQVNTGVYLVYINSNNGSFSRKIVVE
jgi:hypothetical protein